MSPCRPEMIKIIRSISRARSRIGRRSSRCSLPDKSRTRPVPRRRKSWQAVFRGARECRGDVCQEAESIAHGYHHAPSPHDVHRVGGWRPCAARDKREGANADEDYLEYKHRAVCQVALPLREDVKAQVLRQTRARAIPIKDQIAEHHGRAIHVCSQTKEPHTPLDK